NDSEESNNQQISLKVVTSFCSFKQERARKSDTQVIGFCSLVIHLDAFTEWSVTASLIRRTKAGFRDFEFVDPLDRVEDTDPVEPPVVAQISGKKITPPIKGSDFFFGCDLFFGNGVLRAFWFYVPIIVDDVAVGVDQNPCQVFATHDELDRTFFDERCLLFVLRCSVQDDNEQEEDQW
ncbi:MAG TPA: hypothetical protein VK145_01550, partial [Candidatus Nanoarchaeia archaeon]|nr:hypothetical protein [Candidatus Nanoarchaeia archaeon]